MITSTSCRVSLSVGLLAAGVLAGAAVAHPDHQEPPGPLGGPSGLFEAENMIVLGHVPLNEFPGGSVTGADCWGYVSPSGREYALIGLSDGFGFVDVTEPTQPELLLFHDTGFTSQWYDIKVIGEYAYGVSEGGGGIHVFDMRDIDNGNVSFVRRVGSGNTHNIVSNPDSGYIYRTGGVGPGLLIYDAEANPANPPLVGSWDDFYVHDAQVVTYTSGPFAGREIAFTCSGEGNGSGDTALRIVDVTDKSNPVQLSIVRYSTRAYSHQGWLSEDRRYFYLNDELDEQNFGFTTRTRVIDVSDINNPFEADTFTTGLDSIDHNLYVKGDLIFQSNYTSGLRVFDASDPLNPVEIASLDTYLATDDASFNGMWSNYPYLPSGTIIMSDIQQGLVLAKLAIDRLEFMPHRGIPATVPPGDIGFFHAMINEVNLTFDPDTVKMVFTDSQGTREVPGSPKMMRGHYDFFFEDLECFDTVSYYVEAQSTTGETFRFPTSAPGTQLEVLVASDVVPTFEDLFDTDLGWSVQNVGGLSDGAWERGEPVGGGDRGDPTTDFDGNGFCYLTDNEDGNSDVDNGSTRLISPTFDATGGVQAYASYAVYYSNNFGASPNADVFTIDISNNNGATWQNLRTLGPASNNNWEHFRDRFDDLVAPTATMRLRFTASDLGDGSVVEAGVDAFGIETIDCALACSPADLSSPTMPGTPDGVLTGADFFEFLDRFQAGDLSIDFSSAMMAGMPDGVLTGADFFFFLDLFSQGC